MMENNIRQNYNSLRVSYTLKKKLHEFKIKSQKHIMMFFFGGGGSPIQYCYTESATATNLQGITPYIRELSGY
jgi:hypothetical protein